MRIEDRKKLDRIDRQRNDFYYARIIVLDKDENPIQTIEGKLQPGSSVSINGSSNVRRTCNLTLIADEEKNDLTDIDNLLSANKKIRIYTGIYQNIDWGKDIIYYNNNIDASPKSVIPKAAREFGKIYINRNNTLYLKTIIIDGEEKKIIDKKSHRDFPAYYWDGYNFQKLESLYDYKNIIFWYPQGVYVITQPSLSNDASGCRISLSCQDKMCLLNGTMGGNLPASIIFDTYNQEIGKIFLEDGETLYPPVEDPNDYNIYYYNDQTFMYDKKYGWKTVDPNSIDDVIIHKNLIYDIIQTCVVNYGEEAINKVVINDVPREIKQIVRYQGSSPLYYNKRNNVFTFDESQVTDESIWQIFNYNDEIGYVWTDLIYPGNASEGNLATGIGDNVCTVLDKIVQLLGNFEYFYDIDGVFTFQEIKNYLNNSYNPLKDQNNMKPYYIDSNKSIDSADMKYNNLKIIGAENYQADYFGDQKSVYTFNENNELITAYANNPDYTNLKNDFHIWGKSQAGNVIHYHIAIKEIPQKVKNEDGTYSYPTHEVIFKKDDSNNYTGKIRMIQKEDFIGTYATVVNGALDIKNLDAVRVEGNALILNNQDPAVYKGIHVNENDSSLDLKTSGTLKQIVANDWRAELYLSGLEKIKKGDRPDKYEQELLDFFDTIYEWGYYQHPEETVKTEDDFVFEGRFKTDIVNTPNELNYFLDYLEPLDKLGGISVDDIGSKIYSYQQDKIIKLYNEEVPDLILINASWSNEYKDKILEQCTQEGQPFSNIEEGLFSTIAEGVVGYTAQETARNFLYQYTTYNESVTIQSLPIYYLDVNQRITVEDRKTGIFGDYIIKTLTLPLVPTSVMAISAVKAINRI